MNTMKRVVVLGSILAIAVPTAVVAAQAADPVMGTWELNVAKSKYTPGPAPKSETRTYASAPNGYKFTSKGTGADGKPTSATFTIAFDGKYYAVAGNPNADSIMVKKVDAYTVEATLKKGAKVMSHNTRVVSKDGKTLTSTSTGTDAAGKPTSSTAVYDKK